MAGSGPGKRGSGRHLAGGLVELLEQVSTEWLDVPETLTGSPTLADLEIRARTGASVLAVERGGVTTPNPSPATPIEARDRLLVFCASDAVERVHRLLMERCGEP